jgi:hypothetical protein
LIHEHLKPAEYGVSKVEVLRRSPDAVQMVAGIDAAC